MTALRAVQCKSHRFSSYSIPCYRPWGEQLTYPDLLIEYFEEINLFVAGRGLPCRA